MKKIGIALGGGGARGLCQFAFLEVFDELQIRPSIISGTSIGAIIGGFYASGLSVQDIVRIANSIGGMMRDHHTRTNLGCISSAIADLLQSICYYTELLYRINKVL